MKTATVHERYSDRPAFARPNAADRMKKLDRFVEQMLIAGVITACMVMVLFFVSLA